MKIRKRWLLLAFGLAVCLSACQGRKNISGTEGTSAVESHSPADQPEKAEGQAAAAQTPTQVEGEKLGGRDGEAAGKEAGLQSWEASGQPDSSQPDSVQPDSSQPDSSQMDSSQPEGKSAQGERPPSEKEAVSVYYGSVCYSLYSEEEDVIQEIAGILRAAQLEEIEGVSLDADSTYQIYFTTGEEQLAAVNVDKNGIFYLPEEQKFYRDQSGKFSYDQLDKIYQDSMKADGFDAGECLIR